MAAAIDIGQAVRFFPRLEPVTILCQNTRRVYGGYRRSITTLIIHYGPEVNGEIDAASMDVADLTFINNWKNKTLQSLVAFEQASPKRVPPVIKFRFRRQVIENEGVTILAEHQDPLAYIDED